MRKRLSEWAIVSAALLLCVFSLGFFFGRNQANRNDTLVQVSRSAPKTQDELPESASAKAPSPAADASDETKQNGGKLDLNAATVEELTTLPGIGETLAQRIVDYRAVSGGFVTIEQLMEVNGIGEAKFESLKDQITVEEVP